MAEEKSLFIVGKVLPAASQKIVAGQTANSISVETSNNSEYAAESQKFFVTDVSMNKVDLQTQLIDKANGRMRHEILIKYVQELNHDSKPVVFNVQAN